MLTTAAHSMTAMSDAQRPRMIFDCPEHLRRAVKLRAVKRGITPSELITGILQAELAKELREVAAESPPEPEKPKRKPGRPPRPKS